MVSSTKEIVLTPDQLTKYKANYWVRKLDVDNPRNHTGKDLLIYCDNDYGQLNTGSILVFLWNTRWHKIACPDHPTLGEEIPWLHRYNRDKPASRAPTPQPNKGKETASEQSINDSDQKALDDQIRQSPTNIQEPLPGLSSTWKEHFTLPYNPPAMVTQTSSEVETKLATSFDKAFKRMEEAPMQPLEWRPFQGGGEPPGGGEPVEIKLARLVIRSLLVLYLSFSTTLMFPSMHHIDIHTF